ncbi:N-acetyl-alpha-D-glucosaminyl L-malate synthase BshA [Oceanobacillus profundus]|uniref:N-acetyl-alpha-D-glucosaminyl L-malate synthase BshA n=1 Tax=Oceanobacillus profundus TaxID=372463 RepID=A0A417YFS0_9BACI|nr:N-acetyl-alpha-D-glucosaminyl L-malate synthase BshA [Oceanobacillus profundus]PAE29778.1 N-acetyl-alpha-D-glucosaminyl L-malate synthase BshA [Paenibacillus sp. 7884-2]RHW31602.1 N-acetyl-alpha-D-glucosaminyl L-malate synthase BshA [Oceanobacillus profundus]
MKKIGITCYPSVGGSGVIATELGKLLAEQGNEIHFITSSIPFRLTKIHPRIFYHEVELNHYPVFQYPPYDLALAAKMAEVIDQQKLDILHVHYAMPHAICAIMAKDIADHDVKIVTTLHGTDITVLGIDQTFKKVIKHGIEKSDAVTAVSKSLVKQTTEMLDVNKEIATIYNFVNEEDYYKQDVPVLRQQYGISNDEKVLIHISNFRKVKRVRDIIYAFKQVRNEVKSTLLLVGDGPEYPDTVQLVEALGLKEHVRFLGKQTNISELLSISNLMLLLSEKESFGLVLLEAMLCGVPCIGTNIGGIPEVIEHDKTGYLVELGDTDSAANYAIEVLTDNHLMRRLSENALIQAKEKFASEKIVNQYQHLYDTVLTSNIENGD